MKAKSIYEPPKVSKLDYSESILGEEPDCSPLGSAATAGCEDGGTATGWGCKGGNYPENTNTFPIIPDIPGTGV